MKKKGNEALPHRTWRQRISQVLLREPKDRKQLIDVLRESEERNLLDSQSLAMIEGVLQISDMQVRDIMVPRSEMTVIEKTQDYPEILKIIVDTAHSRYPVIGENRDEIMGILLVKDLIRFQITELASNPDLLPLIRPAMVVPESKRLDVLLQEFRKKRTHMAIVVDEYGNIAGLVTIEDILEEIVGDIEDEYDIEIEFNIRKENLNNYLVKALTSIDKFNEYFNSNFASDEVDTIGGLISLKFGHIPKRGETLSLDGFKFKVLQTNNRRVQLLKVTRP